MKLTYEQLNVLGSILSNVEPRVGSLSEAQDASTPELKRVPNKQYVIEISPPMYDINDFRFFKTITINDEKVEMS